MRKIDKNCVLSTIYKVWEEDLEAKKVAHPKYGNTTTNKLYYLDIVMQLYHCQDGLCAYTERLLCAKKHFTKKKWKDGKYDASAKPSDNVEGHLDHFNPDLKSKKADQNGRKDWLWDNFFMINERINAVVKRDKPVDDILKPDAKNYDPFNLLDYDPTTHTFIPNPSLDETASKRVQTMLETLGVNYFNERRRSYLEVKLKLVFMESKNWDDLEITQFPTAFAFCKKKVEEGQIAFDDLFARNIIDRDEI